MAQMFFLTHANMGLPVAFLMIGLIFLLISLPCAAFVYYDAEHAIITTVICSITFLHAYAVEIAWYRIFLKNFERRLLDLPNYPEHIERFRCNTPMPVNNRVARMLGLDIAVREMRIMYGYFYPLPLHDGMELYIPEFDESNLASPRPGSNHPPPSPGHF
eukprot:CAMPEP_0174901832 /NCGR_PEP_ID=MMETSP0167-20121228/35906_1 /TAXON_ID=38298 /ORGANISM="Rhodella maculata, Strain CCMP736" /LENGTH=159 /DNA_ID=CAMNT_0016143641 /DNA_START=244 /DNA_END=723 /DNA_ORIENTATION=+